MRKPATSYTNGKAKSRLAEGQYGTVRAARHLATSTLVAIKNYTETRPDLCFKGCLEEVSFYIHLGHHPNLVKPLDVTTTSKGLGIVFEHFDQSLDSFFATALPADVMQETCRQVARGLEWVHSRNVIHGDLKQRNILVCCSDRQTAPWTTPLHSNLRVVLADFGGSIWNSNRFATPAWPMKGGTCFKFCGDLLYSWICIKVSWSLDCFQ